MAKINHHAPYRNGFEAAMAIKHPDHDYEPKDIRLPYVLHHQYVPDFVDRENKVIRESKGLFTAEDRRKMLAVKAAHPDWTIVMVFQKPDRKISKNSSTTYAQFCEKNDIQWEQGPVSLKAPRKKKDSNDS